MAVGTSALLSALLASSATLTDRMSELEGSAFVRSKPALAQRLGGAAEELLADIFAAESAARSVGWRQRQKALEGLSCAESLIRDMKSWLALDGRQRTASALDQLEASLTEVSVLLHDVTESLGNSASGGLYRIA